MYVILDELRIRRSSRTTLSEAVIPLDAPIDVVEDTNVDPFVGLSIVSDTTNVDVQFNMPSEAVPTVPFLCSTDEKHMKAAEQWQHNITGVGQRFNNVTEFREALRKYAVAHQFAFKYKKKKKSYPWRIHASGCQLHN